MSNSFLSGQSGPPSLPELETALQQLLPLLGSLPPGTDWLDALKKPGAWHEKPLPPNHPPLPGATVQSPYHLQVPENGCAIDLVNVSPTELLRDLHLCPIGSDDGGNATLTIPASLARR